MRWLTYYILAYIAVGLQIGLAQYLEVRQARPDLVLLAVIFIAINAPREAALLGAFGLGMMTDLVSLAPLGLYAFSYALVGMFVVSTQELVYREHPLTHFSLGLVASLQVSAVLLVHGWIHGGAPPLMALFASALYTAILAPVLLGVLQRIKRLFAFQPKRRVRAY